MSSVNHTSINRATDLSGQENHLDDNNIVTFGRDNLAPYASFVASSFQFLNRTDELGTDWASIIGTETYITSGLRGLTLGGWFWASAFTSEMHIIGQGTGSLVGQLSYRINWRGDLAAEPFIFRISTGANNPSVTSSVDTATNQWYFVTGRFTPSTSLDVYVNGIWTSAASSAASIADTDFDFTIGASAAPSAYFDGRASMCFLCAAALPDAIIGQLYEQSRIMFGVL
ncbi:MAG: LamG-like jellyroll fold domain-containing protein [Planctomycetota bacterium]|jgi:hypothetical protein